ncbi:hypothetical protein SAMN02745218_02182, partial [Desulfofundulus australicus DSM 11792]
MQKTLEIDDNPPTGGKRLAERHKDKLGPVELRNKISTALKRVLILCATNGSEPTYEGLKR